MTIRATCAAHALVHVILCMAGNAGAGGLADMVVCPMASGAGRALMPTDQREIGIPVMVERCAFPRAGHMAAGTIGAA